MPRPKMFSSIFDFACTGCVQEGVYAQGEKKKTEIDKHHFY